MDQYRKYSLNLKINLWAIVLVIILIFVASCLTSCSPELSNPTRPDIAKQAKKDQQIRLSDFNPF